MCRAFGSGVNSHQTGLVMVLAREWWDLPATFIVKVTRFADFGLYCRADWAEKFILRVLHDDFNYN
jgi:hypothetical protein